jgi:hypothetical protein
MRTFAGFSHYAVSPAWRRPPAGRRRRPPANGAKPRWSLWRRCAASSVPCAAKMRYPVEALRRDCRGPSAREAVRDRRRAIGSAGERLVHTEEVTGSIPVSPTDVSPGQRPNGQLSSYTEDGSFCRLGGIWEIVFCRVRRSGASRLSSRGTGECGSMLARSRSDSSQRAWRAAVSSSRIRCETWAYRPRIPGMS